MKNVTLINSKYSHSFTAREVSQGTVLIIGLIIMGALTVLAVVGMRGSIGQEVLSRNSYEKFRMRSIAESLNNHAMSQNQWLNKALGLSGTGTVLTYTISDASVVGSEAVNDFNMSVDIEVSPLPLSGASSGASSTGQVVMLVINSRVISKANSNDVSELERGYLRLVAKFN